MYTRLTSVSDKFDKVEVADHFGYGFSKITIGELSHCTNPTSLHKILTAYQGTR